MKILNKLNKKALTYQSYKNKIKYNSNECHENFLFNEKMETTDFK